MIRWLAIFTAGIVAVLPALSGFAASRPPLTTSKGVVAADNEQASLAGARVLAGGGNAVDAAVATALALGVVHPASSGIGGGGFAIVYIAAEKKTYAFDFREVGPRLITPQLFSPGGTYDPSLSRSGGLAVGVPGEIAGLHLMSERFGAVPWARSVQPAIELAARGFRISDFLHHAVEAWTARAPETSRLGRVLSHYRGRPVGAIARRRHLAATLRRIAANGRDGFYRGPVATDIAATVQSHGGVLDERDLRDYEVVERQPLVRAWRGLRIATMPLPSSGGIAVLQVLGILEAKGTDLAALGAGSSAAIHLTAEALKHAFADRARVLGADTPDSLLSELLAPARLARLAKRVSATGVQRHDRYGDQRLGRAKSVRERGGTSHLCVVDAAGNAVALTTTVNTYFGSGLVTSRTGIVLNNEVDDFATSPGAANAFGLVQSDFNRVGPGKRPLSSMTPTLVFDGDRVVGCAGGSGGPRIISNTLQVLLNVFVFGMDVAEAVSAGRIHHQWLPDALVIEPDMVRDVRKALKKRGQVLKVSPYATAVQAITVDGAGRRSAASDPRKGGRPAAER